MFLLRLPPEILIQIFDHVGSCYFRSDVSRLTVCKQWSNFAIPACFQNLHFTQGTLRRLMSSAHKDTSLCLLQDSMRSLDIDLKDYDDWDTMQSLMEDARNTDTPLESIWDIVPSRQEWTTELNDDLCHLAAFVEDSQKLRKLRITTSHELDPTLRLPEDRSYPSLSAMRGFLTPNTLTSLDLDLYGTEIVPQSYEEHLPEFHICRNIARILTTLRRLRLRMRKICPDVLKVQEHATKLRLNEVLVNLSVSDESSVAGSTDHAARCRWWSGGTVGLKADMETQAQALVARMKAPKMVRILTHGNLTLRMRASDVLTGAHVLLGGGADWDDEGEPIDPEKLDGESETSSLDSDDEIIIFPEGWSDR